MGHTRLPILLTQQPPSPARRSVSGNFCPSIVVADRRHRVLVGAVAWSRGAVRRVAQGARLDKTLVTQDNIAVDTAEPGNVPGEEERMIYTNGHQIISDKNNTELFKFAKRVGISQRWFCNHSRNPHFEIPPRCSAEILRDAGAQFKYGEQWFKIIDTHEYQIRCQTLRPRIFLPRVRRQGTQFYRRCPACRQESAVEIYSDQRAEEALRYISRPEWECTTCQRHTEETQRARI